jgi:bifunctional non-homologous end joining protein LigD
VANSPGNTDASPAKPAKSDKSIDAYRAKRDFSRTPEPSPEDAARVASAAFVVHRHEARRLHYDLRLEMDGVLTSWAVPRCFSYDPTVKKLAVRTEDHPLAYTEFHGVIPKGEYGGGTMTIWDRGRYELLKSNDGPEAVAAGKIEFRLYGAKLRGEWHLVKTRSEKQEWILFHARDRYARDESEKAPFFELDAANATPLPRHFELMSPAGDTEPFTDPDWLFEVEFAGKRAGLRIDNEVASLVGVDGSPLTGILDDAKSLRCENGYLDGVLVATDDNQRPSREVLERRLRGDSDAPVVFYAFDLLYYEEWDLTPLALIDRKQMLATVVPKLTHILFVDHVLSRGKEFCDVTAAAGLPAVIAKRSSSPYTPGAATDWRRIPIAHAEAASQEDLAEALRKQPREHKIKFTNLDKVLWPEDGYTKGDLIRYYDHVAGALLPYLYERPCHMLRYPDGIHGKAFYQKDAPSHIPDWVETEVIGSESKGEAIRYIVCNDRDTLVLMANLASIDIHPWFSRRGSPDSPDWAVFDLDPDGSPFPDVVKIARTLGKVLRGIGLRPYLKTSGATGLHVYVPVQPSYTYEHTKQFCEAVSIHVAQEHADIATVERVVSRRRGKVYIDFLQNRKGQTIVPPYAARPRPKAPVSAPLDWDELDLDLEPTAFNIKTMPTRLAKLGDLFQGTLRDPQDLLPAIEAFQKHYLDS